MEEPCRKKLKARFRAKKSYLIRIKGMSESEAERIAASVFAESNAVGISQANLIHSKNKPREATWRFTQAISHSLLISNLGVTSISLLIVGIASFLLVNSSLHVFGNTLQGWGKALVLELGILALAATGFGWKVFKKDCVSFIVSKTALAFLIFLSFSVLHTGVETQRAEGVNSLATMTHNRSDLIVERDRWLAVHDSYAENRHSDKRDALRKISELNEKISAERALVLESLDARVIEKKSDTEMMMRAALLLLNIIFGHKLATELTKLRWPLQRESLSG